MSEYLLGHSEQEWDRLHQQHALWGPALLADLVGLGLGQGTRLLEVGCGNGTLLEDLAALAGPTGRAHGVERDPAAADKARARVGDTAEVTTGDLMETPLGGPWDAIVARWVFSFLPDAAEATARLASALRPGGWLVVHDYNHEGLGAWPSDPAIVRVIEAFREAYRRRGGDLWVAARMPRHLARAGLVDLRMLPHVMAGPPDSAVWGWVERFLSEHAGSLVTDAVLSADELGAFEAAWARTRAAPGAVLFSPLQVTVAARRPGRGP